MTNSSENQGETDVDVAQQLTQLAGADERYERARAVALDALVGAAGGGTPVWHRAELYYQ